MEPVVLIVDDDEDFLRLAEQILSASGFRVTAAASGIDALGLLRDDELPDIVILDVEMPDLDGWEMLTRIRRGPRTRHLPVVMCTSQDRLIDVHLGWSLGCDGYVIKPINAATLATQLREVLSRDPAERERVRRARLADLRRCP